MYSKKLREVEFTEDGIVGGPVVWLAHGIGGRGLCHPIEIFSLDEQGRQLYLVSFGMSEKDARKNWHRLSDSAKALIEACECVCFTE